MTKEEIRHIYLKKRRFMELNIVSLFSQKIKQTLSNNFNFESKNVSLFTSIAEKNEVITEGLIDVNEANVYAPVMMPKRELLHIKITENTEWIKNDWDILEPSQEGEALAPELFDYVIVPLIVADRKGYRVGYGGGYYDRFLAACNPNCIFIGVGFHDLVDEITDINEFDIPLDFYISPGKVNKF